MSLAQYIPIRSLLPPTVKQNMLSQPQAAATTATMPDTGTMQVLAPRSDAKNQCVAEQLCMHKAGLGGSRENPLQTEKYTAVQMEAAYMCFSALTTNSCLAHMHCKTRQIITYADQNVAVFEAGAALAQAGNKQRRALRRARSG